MDYSKHCWFCGKVAVEAKGSYYQCPGCGATWNKLPEPVSFIDIEVEEDGCTTSTKYRPVKRRGKTLPKVKR